MRLAYGRLIAAVVSQRIDYSGVWMVAGAMVAQRTDDRRASRKPNPGLHTRMQESLHQQAGVSLKFRRHH
jgi:hypothetical protein